VAAESAVDQEKSHFLEGLSSDERHLVESASGPHLLIAGPGTGKTRVLSHRMAYLLRTEPRLRAGALLAFAPTWQAGRKISAALTMLLPNRFEYPTVTTPIDFASAFVESNWFRMGFHQAPKLITADIDRVPLVEKVLERAGSATQGLKQLSTLRTERGEGASKEGGEETVRFFKTLLSFLDQVRDERIGVKRYEQLARKLDLEPAPQHRLLRKRVHEERSTQKSAAALYTSYAEALRVHNFLDGRALLECLVKYFRSHEDALRRWRDRHGFIFVDDFQETSALEVDLLETLAGPNGQILVAGDDDQALSPRPSVPYAAFKQFLSAYPHAKIVTLSENRRSSGHILSVAGRLISANEADRYERAKVVRTERPLGDPVTVRQFSDFDEEALWIGRRIRYAVNMSGRRFSDIAILLRRPADALIFSQALAQLGIPFREVRDPAFFSWAEIKDFLAILHLAVDPRDDIALTRLLRSPLCGWSAERENELSALAKSKRVSMFESLELLAKGHAEDRALLDEINQLRERLKALGTHARSSDAWRVVRQAATLFQVMSRLMQRRGADAEPALRRIGLLMEKARHFSDNYAGAATLRSFLDYLALGRRLGGFPDGGHALLPEETDAVAILSIAEARHYEFPVVFIPALVENRFPESSRHGTSLKVPAELFENSASEEKGDVERERRLLYVGVTRATEQLMLTTVARFPHLRPSVFLTDIEAERARGALSWAAVPEIRLDPMPMLQGLTYPDAELGQKSPLRKLAEIVRRASGGAEKRKRTPAQAAGSASPFSFAELDTYRSCPLKYKFRYFYKVPASTDPRGALEKIIRVTLERYLCLIEGGHAPSFDAFQRIFEESWSGGAYGSKRQARHHKDWGRSLLEKFFARLGQLGDRTPVLCGETFEVHVDGIWLKGRLDRVDRAEDGALEVTQYELEERVWNTAAENWRLFVYSLVADRRLGVPPKKIRQMSLSGGPPLELSMNRRRLVEGLRIMRDAAENIRRGNFPPYAEALSGARAEDCRVCRSCDYQDLCPVWAGGKGKPALTETRSGVILKR